MGAAGGDDRPDAGGLSPARGSRKPRADAEAGGDRRRDPPPASHAIRGCPETARRCPDWRPERAIGQGEPGAADGSGVGVGVGVGDGSGVGAGSGNAIASSALAKTSGPTRSWFVATAIVNPESGR